MLLLLLSALVFLREMWLRVRLGQPCCRSPAAAPSPAQSPAVLEPLSKMEDGGRCPSPPLGRLGCAVGLDDCGRILSMLSISMGVGMGAGMLEAKIFSSLDGILSPRAS